MAKVKKSTIWKNFCLTVSLLCGLAAIIMICFDVVQTLDGDTIYKGHQVVFPYFEDVPSTEWVKPVFNFSFGNFAAYLLAGLGVVCCVAAIAYKKQGLVLAVLTMLLFIGAGVLFLEQAANIAPNLKQEMYWWNLGGITGDELTAKINEKSAEIAANHKLAWGAIVAATCCFVAAAGALTSKILWQVHANKGN